MSNLQIGIDFLTQPNEGDNIAFKVRNEGIPLTYDISGQTKVEKVFTSSEDTFGNVTSNLVRLSTTGDYLQEQLDFKNFTTTLESALESDGSFIYPTKSILKVSSGYIIYYNSLNLPTVPSFATPSTFYNGVTLSPSGYHSILLDNNGNFIKVLQIPECQLSNLADTKYIRIFEIGSSLIVVKSTGNTNTFTINKYNDYSTTLVLDSAFSTLANSSGTNQGLSASSSVLAEISNDNNFLLLNNITFYRGVDYSDKLIKISLTTPSTVTSTSSLGNGFGIFSRTYKNANNKIFINNFLTFDDIVVTSIRSSIVDIDTLDIQFTNVINIPAGSLDSVGTALNSTTFLNNDSYLQLNFMGTALGVTTYNLVNPMLGGSTILPMTCSAVNPPRIKILTNGDLLIYGISLTSINGQTVTKGFGIVNLSNGQLRTDSQVGFMNINVGIDVSSSSMSYDIDDSDGLIMYMYDKPSITNKFYAQLTSELTGDNVVRIGDTLAQTITNTLNSLNTFNSRSDVSYTVSSDTIIFQYDFEDNYVDVTEIEDENGRVEIQIIQNESISFSELVQDLRARSQELYKSTTESFDTTQFKIWAYRGDIFSFYDTFPTYIKTKQKVVSTQDTIFMNISDLVKEKLETSISNYVSNSNGIQQTNLDNNKWVRVESENFLLGESVDDNTRFYYVTDGYKDYNDLSVNLPNLLMTGRKRYYNKESIKRLFFKTPNLLSIVIIDGLDATLIDGVTEIGNSVDLAKNIGLNSFNSNKVSLSFTYTTGVETLEIELSDRCSKYELVDLVFKNKYGFLETLSFDKLSKTSIEVDRQSYNRSIVDFNGNFTPTRHTKKDFNVTGKKSITLNTDWIPEYMNPVFEELLLSEEVYMLNGNQATPVNLKTNTLVFKKKVNEGLINYTIDVEVSHEQIQNFI